MVILGVVVCWIAVSNRAGNARVQVGFNYAQALVRLELPPDDRFYAIDLSRQRWFWGVPFVAATVMYCLGSIVHVVSHHPWRWFAGSIVGCTMLVQLAQSASMRPMAAIARSLLVGRFGLATVLTGFARSQNPGMADWLQAALVWLLVCFVCLLGVMFRYQDA